jgi:hypothetical protein
MILKAISLHLELIVKFKPFIKDVDVEFALADPPLLFKRVPFATKRLDLLLFFKLDPEVNFIGQLAADTAFVVMG